MKKKLMLLSGLMVLLMAAPALAHFQMVYTPEIALMKGGTLNFKLVFTHPFSAGHTMDMGKPEGFYMLYSKGDKPVKTDLMKAVKPIEWESQGHKGKAYEADVKIRKMGDYILVFTPAPYLEEEEGIYIQQISKVIVNVGGLPGNWNEAVGLPAEIVPLNKPYAMWTNNVFRGIVLKEGKPVPDAEIEVEYMNHQPLTDKNKFAEKAEAEAPHPAFETMTIFADKDGQFSFGIPKAGWWGFCALGVGSATEFNGKELSQDAVIWIKAVDMK
jgi:cobalt/nickel transport protein